ncbi:MAG: putative collagen-binding protein [Acidobacteriaceae bacterium]|nr:putative collagen-binding protein [Acidobacteriaceae bacterium]
MRVSALLRLILLLCLAAISPVVLLAQGSQGTISGRVTDPSGSPVRGATVSVTNTATAQEKHILSNEDGYYSFQALKPSTYVVKVTMAGFKATVTNGLVLEVNQTLTNDLSLVIGSVDTSVEVQATAPLIQRETSSTGQVINSQQIVEMPLNGRNFLNLSLLVPGASENPGSQSIFSINGARGNETSILLDGIDARLFQNGRPAITPSVDAVQEFKIQQNANSAAYGDGLAIINAAIRSGSNQFHGDVWEFIRNDVLDAKPYFSSTVPILRRNQFGFAAGGPIWRNHTFFFANYEGSRIRTSGTLFALIPTQAQLSGDFSGSATIYDPNNLDSTGHRIAFANNIIPASRISRIATAAAKLYPAPKASPRAGTNYFGAVSNPDDADQQNYRIDHQIGPRDSIYGRYSKSKEAASGFNAPLPFSGTVNSYKGIQGLIHETHVFSPSILNDFAIGYTYGLFSLQLILNDHDAATQDFGLTNLKIPSFEWGAPILSVQGYTSMGSPINVPTGGYENNYQLDDDVTWAHGAHTLRAGVEIRQFRPAQYDPATPNGNISFDGRFTGADTTHVGNPVADLVLGAPYTATVTQLVTSDGLVTLRWNQYQAYLQDDYKITPKLTLNLGMRYEYQQPFREVHGLANVWDQATNSFLTPGSGIDGLIKPDHNNFAPRVGFAYSITPRTVVRGGTGVYFGFIRGAELSSGYGLNPPFLTSTTVNSSTTAPTLGAGIFPVASPAVTPTSNIFSVSHTLPDNYTYQYNLTVQQQVTPSFTVQAAYVGSSSHKLIGRDLINQARVDANPAAPTSILSRRPFQGAADISITKAIDQANYNALQVTAEKRASHGVSLLAAYTYAKALGIAEAGDQSAIGNEYVPRRNYYGPTVYNQPQRLTVSPVLELPVGRSKAYLNSLPALLDKFVSGWSATGIGTFFKGESISPTSNVSANVGRVDRNFPNCVGKPNAGPRTLNKWFDTTAIVSQPVGTFGNCRAGVIQVPGENNIDIAAIKNTVFHERYRAEFRGEFFNALNHASFGNPNTTVGSAAFGTITSTRTNNRQIQFGLKLYW